MPLEHVPTQPDTTTTEATTEATPRPDDWPPHEVRAVTGSRSGLPIVVALDSTLRGSAIGGVRVRHYAGWRDGLADALDLARAMTHKCALADVPHGGGKTVVVLPPDGLPPQRRPLLLEDIAVVLRSLGGTYLAGPDMGTGPDDMRVLHERTGFAFCRPVEDGGAGDSAPGTATGVLESLGAAARRTFGSDDPAGLRVGVVGYGNVGRRITAALVARGAEVYVSDADTTLRRTATDAGAVWLDTPDLLQADHDVLVPAAGGGLLDPGLAATLHHRLVVGPANNQLSHPAVAQLLAGRGVVWVPDAVASAGGIISTLAREEAGLDNAGVAVRLARIGATTDDVLAEAAATGHDTHTVATRLSLRRLGAG